MIKKINNYFTPNSVRKYFNEGCEITLTLDTSIIMHGHFIECNENYFIFQPSTSKDNLSIPIDKIKTINPVKKSNHFTNHIDQPQILPLFCCLNEVVLNNGAVLKFLMSHVNDKLTFRTIGGKYITRTINLQDIIYVN